MTTMIRSLPVGTGAWLLLTAGCTAMRAVDRADLSPPNPPTRVWVTRADHSTVVVDYPRVSADSLIGMVSGWPERLPLSEFGRPSSPRTVAGSHRRPGLRRGRGGGRRCAV
jgi:hypothetical protein